MAKTLDDAKTAILKLESGSELWKLVEALKTSADSVDGLKEEATKSKKGLSTLHSTYNKVLATLKDVGYEEGEVPEFITGLKDKLAKVAEAETKAKGSESENQKLLNQIESLGKKFEKADDDAKREKKLRRQGVIREALTSKFKDKSMVLMRMSQASYPVTLLSWTTTKRPCILSRTVRESTLTPVWRNIWKRTRTTRRTFRTVVPGAVIRERANQGTRLRAEKITRACQPKNELRSLKTAASSKINRSPAIRTQENHGRLHKKGVMSWPIP